MRVLFAGGGTGGHLYPGLAIARELVRQRPAVRPFFVGAQRGIEREVLPKSEFPHLLLDLHPLYRSRPWQNWRTVAGAFSAWRALRALEREEPIALVVGTGGYAAGLALAYAVRRGIPVVQQAGDSYPGLTARAFSRWSREVYLNFPEAARAMRARTSGSLITTGAPIEPPPEPRPDRGTARAAWGFPAGGGRVLLVFGGSQGSLAVNAAVAGWIERGLPSGLHLIWATGPATHERFARFDGGAVRVRPFISPIAEAYAAADLAVARAGAMATAELLAWGIPAVLVPLPTAAQDHQTTNARTLEAAGAAVHLPQRELSAERLDAEVRALLDDPARLSALAAAALGRARPHAGAEIARRILVLVEGAKAQAAN